jgi:hypothetical protein
MVATVRDRRENLKSPVVRTRKPHYVKTKDPVVLGNRGSFPCQYCGKVYSSEKIVVTHMCEQRRRFNQKDAPFARFGLEAFFAIQAMFFGNHTKNTEGDFRKSDFYLACMRWGHFVIDVNAMNPKQYLSWLLKMKIPIDQWDKDNIYDCWLQYYVFIEDPWDAFERSVKKMAFWSEEVGKPYEEYFRSAGNARVLTDVRKGWINGWAVFSSKSGREWLNELSQGDLELVWAWLDPSRWKIRLENMEGETTAIKKICNESGL